jgi:GGDEF domain-containing protein
VLEARLRREPGPCTIALFETYPHEDLAADESITGDEALAALSTAVRSEVTGLDVVFSWYDGQIAVGFHDMTQDAAADRVRRIALRLAEKRLRLDAGLAFRSDSESVGALIERAGDALAPVSVD